MPARISPHLKAVLQALAVTFLWSTSWVLIKIGLADVPALPFAGLRYALAFLCILPFVLTRARLASLRSFPPRLWVQLVLLGLTFYTINQGAQYLGLAYLPAITVSLLLNFSAVVVALAGIPLLGERPTYVQWLGIVLSIGGTLLYFYPVSLPAGQALGVAIVMMGVLGRTGAALLGRAINRCAPVDALTVTVVSMGIGSLLLLAGGVMTQGLPSLSVAAWGIIAWLAVVNTAVAFTLWNHTLRILSAMESSIINNTMLVQIAVLAWLFLGEGINVREGVGLAAAGVGALVASLGAPVLDKPCP